MSARATGARVTSTCAAMVLSLWLGGCRKAPSPGVEPDPTPSGSVRRDAAPEAQDVGQPPLEVMRGPTLILLHGEGSKVWWQVADGIYELELPAGTPRKVFDGKAGTAGPGGIAWSEVDPLCTGCMRIMGQSWGGKPRKLLGLTPHQTLRGLAIHGSEVFVLRSGPVGSVDPHDGEVVAIELSSGKSTVLASGRPQLTGDPQVDATHVYFGEYDGKPTFCRVPRGKGPVEVLGDTVGAVFGPAGLFAFSSTGDGIDRVQPTKATPVPGTDHYGPRAVSTTGVIGERDLRLVHFTPSGPKVLTRSPHTTHQVLVVDGWLVWTAGDEKANNLRFLYRVPVN